MPDVSPSRSTPGNKLTIDITDDGCGVDPDNQRGSGVANFEQRAELVGGRCQIGTRPRYSHPVDRATRWALPQLLERKQRAFRDGRPQVTLSLRTDQAQFSTAGRLGCMRNYAQVRWTVPRRTTLR